jgi:hypothetical protein
MIQRSKSGYTLWGYFEDPGITQLKRIRHKDAISTDYGMLFYYLYELNYTNTTNRFNYLYCNKPKTGWKRIW